MIKESPSPDAILTTKAALDDTALSQRPQRPNSNLSTLASLSPGEGEKEKIEPSDLEDQSHIWAGFEQDVLPDKEFGGVLGNIRYQILQVYRRLFGMVFLINVGLFISVAVKGAVAPQIGLIALSNLLVAVMLREDYVVRAIFAIFTAVPSSWPLWIRRICANVYRFGGIHSGCGVSGIMWHVLFCAQATIEMIQKRETHTSVNTVALAFTVMGFLICIFASAFLHMRILRKNFETYHRSLGWTTTVFVWAMLVLSINDYRPPGVSLANAVVHAPPFWMLTVMTVSIIRPWAWLRPIKPRVEVLSSSVRRLHFDYATPSHGSFIRMSHHPWVDLHKCATITEPGAKGFSVIISAPDWTTEQVAHVPSPMWILDGALPSPMRIIPLFRSVLLVATGPGIVPCISPVLEQKIPTHLLWTSANPREELGEKLVDKLTSASPSIVIYDAHVHGEPDLVKLTYRMVKMTNAEVVIILSQKALADKVVYGMRSRGISAFGA